MFAGLQFAREPNKVSLLRLRKTLSGSGEDAAMAGYPGGSEEVQKLLYEAQVGVEAGGKSYGSSNFYNGNSPTSAGVSKVKLLNAI